MEFLLEVDDLETAKSMAPVVKMYLENAGSFFIKTVPVKADPYIGKYWEKH